ncbi:MFS transporter [Microbacterium saperdae]|uniref:MFS transporter n=1 Tax=Microbacterium saperdae TaxID=69368 RepID=A0A543BIT8_9MICO|nr:MFS transporter [Microbacterium saperdae]TQL84767.1 MFS transporter [Microbacterium saperdae]GGM64224.1 MFS transporter [Microbacterium saperdae]
MTIRTDNAVDLSHRRWALTGLAVIVLAAASLEGFVLPALPRLQQDFGVDAASGALASVVPTVITVIVTPLAGRLADVYGAGRTLAGLVAIVLAGGLTSAFAADFTTFIVGQALQGFALGIIPVGFVVLRHLFLAESIKTASGVLVAMSVAGAGLGVLTAGPIIEATSRAVLYAVPTAVVALGAVVFFAARPGLRRDPDARTGVDWLGAGVFAVALVVLVVALASSSSAGWTAPTTLLLFVAAIALLTIWVWIESRVAQPMIDVGSLRSRSVGGAVAVGVAIGAGYAPIVFLLPQVIAQPIETGYGLGATASQTGMFLAVAYAAGVISSVAAGRVARSTGLRAVGVIAMLALGLGAAAAVFSPAPASLVLMLLLAGVGAAAASTIVYAAAAIGAEAHEVGVSTALITIARAVGGALATQVVASLITTDGAPPFATFQVAFGVAAAISIAGAAVAFWLLPRERAELSGLGHL